MEKGASEEEIGLKIIDACAVSTREVDEGAEPFVYSTGNRGPGYVMIKGLVGQRKVMKFLTRHLALRVEYTYGTSFNFVEGNATGGMIPAWQLTDDIEKVLGLEEGSIPYAYLRESRKEGGHGELITGIGEGSGIKHGMKPLIVEELVNYAGTTCNAANIYRSAGYPVLDAACILFYDTPDANAKLKDASLTLHSLITLPELLNVGETNRRFSASSVRSYREFLADPVEWQLKRDLVIPADSAKRAIEKGYQMRELSREEALQKGAPASKVDRVVYWEKVK